MTSQQAEELMGEISRLVDAHVRRTGRGRAALTSLVLRALKQAHYSPRNLGHAGLRSPRYCHFTSPIRRYPDLVCHRALLASIGGGEDPPEASGLEAAAEWTSAREREAMAVERDADDVAHCFLLAREVAKLGHRPVYDGEVVGLAPVGAFVAFGDAYEGLLPVRRLRDDWWELNEQGTILVGTQSGRTLRLGDPVRVEVGRIDAPRGRVDLHPVDLPG
jgi:ribonuclease R